MSVGEGRLPMPPIAMKNCRQVIIYILEYRCHLELRKDRYSRPYDYELNPQIMQLVYHCAQLEENPSLVLAQDPANIENDPPYPRVGFTTQSPGHAT